MTETVNYTGGMQGDTLATEGVSDEEVQDAEGNYTEANGSGNTDTASDVSPRAASDPVDESGSASTSHDLRSERAGTGDGRTYTIAYEVTNIAGAQVCMGSFEIAVPHDQRDKKN